MLHVVILQDLEVSITMLLTTAHIENQWNTEMIFHNWGLVFVSSVNKDFSSESRLYFYWIDMKYLRQAAGNVPLIQKRHVTDRLPGMSL